MTVQRRCPCRHQLRDARADQIELVIARNYSGELALTDGEIRKIRSANGLTRSALETAISDLAHDGRVTFQVTDGPLVILLAEARG